MTVANHDVAHAMVPNAAGPGDPEIQAMNSEAPLLELVRSDTGELGRESGGVVYFKRCPVCGHSNCFRYYPATNSWSCFGDSNATGYRGGSYVEYQRAVHGMDASGAVRALREATGRPRGRAAVESDECFDFEGNIISVMPTVVSGGGVATEGTPNGQVPSGQAEATLPKLLLPPWEQVRAVDPPRRAPALIEGVLRRGHVGLIAGKGKSGKSWSGIELSVAVATGGSWFGHACGCGRVLFVDPELDQRSLDNRFAKVCRAMGADPAAVEAGVVRWSLRGVMRADGMPPTIADVAHDVEARCAIGDFALVVIDSASCLIEGDENASVDVRRFFAHVLRIPKATGAAVLVVHHFGKALAGDRDSIDRARGSSVWGDSPDAPMSLTEIFPPNGSPSDYLGEGERAFLLEDSGLREFPGMEPLRLIFSYPVHRVDAEGVTDGWKPRTSTARGGRKTGEGNRQKSEARADRCVIALLGEFVRRGVGAEGVPANEAAELVSEAIGETVKASTLKGYVEASDALDVWQKSPRRWSVVPRRPPSEGDEQEEMGLDS